MLNWILILLLMGSPQGTAQEYPAEALPFAEDPIYLAWCDSLFVHHCIPQLVLDHPLGFLSLDEAFNSGGYLDSIAPPGLEVSVVPNSCLAEVDGHVAEIGWSPDSFVYVYDQTRNTSSQVWSAGPGGRLHYVYWLSHAELVILGHHDQVGHLVLVDFERLRRQVFSSTGLKEYKPELLIAFLRNVNGLESMLRWSQETWGDPSCGEGN